MSASLSLSYLSRNWLICMLVLFLVSHRSLGLSSLFFKNYFSFFCFNQVISKLSFSNLHTCFLFDFFCWWRLSFCIFHFINGILQLQNFFWFFFMTLLCLSLISSNCHLVLFYISLNFLRRAILNCLSLYLALNKTSVSLEFLIKSLYWFVGSAIYVFLTFNVL